MHGNRNLTIFVVSCLAIFASCFLNWSSEPSYSLFTIADYGASYGQYISEAKLVAVIAFLLPAGALLTLCSVAHEKTCRILAIVFGSYALAFAIGVLALVVSILNKFPTPSKNMGIYLCIVFAVVLLVTGIIGRSVKASQSN